MVPARDGWLVWRRCRGLVRWPGQIEPGHGCRRWLNIESDSSPHSVCYSGLGWQVMVGTLASELGPSNINVNAVAPGFVDTQMPRQHAHWLGEDYAAFSARIAAQVPLRRKGTVEEQAAVITFLCSDDASYVTGQVISVSGGA